MRIILLTLIGFFTLGSSFAQEIVFKETVDVSLKTVFIGNRQFLVSDDWSTIPVNLEEREDMNSPKFGGKFYPMRNNDGLNEKRVSIANQNMEVWVDVKNETAKTWKLHAVGIEILDQYQLDLIGRVEKGLWRSYTSRLNQYSPRIVISKHTRSKLEKKTIKSVFIEPIGGITDNRFSIRLLNSSKEPLEDLVYEFEIFMVLVNTENLEEVIKVKSDKHYFLGFKK